MKGFECPKSIINHEKNNAWNIIIRLVERSSIPSTQRASIFILKIIGFLGWFRPIELLRVHVCPVLFIIILCWLGMANKDLRLF